MAQENLLQENEKLNARLKKAIGVFNEQKATIDRLNTEKDTLNERLDEANERIKELEALYKEASEKNNESDTRFFEQLNDIDALTQVNKAFSEENDSLNSQVAKLTETNKTLNNKLKITQDELEHANGVIESCEVEIANYKKEIYEQHETIDNLNVSLDTLESALQQELKKYHDHILVIKNTAKEVITTIDNLESNE